MKFLYTFFSLMIVLFNSNNHAMKRTHVCFFPTKTIRYNTDLIPPHIVDLCIDGSFENNDFYVNDETATGTLPTAHLENGGYYPKRFTDLCKLVFYANPDMDENQIQKEFDDFANRNERFFKDNEAIIRGLGHRMISEPKTAIEGKKVTITHYPELGNFITAKYIEPRDKIIENFKQQVDQLSQQNRAFQEAKKRKTWKNVLFGSALFASGILASPYILPYLKNTQETILKPAIQKVQSSGLFAQWAGWISQKTDFMQSYCSTIKNLFQKK